MPTETSTLCALTVLAVLVAADAPAQDAPGVSAETLLKATPIKRVPPSYPQTALANGEEGWVKLSFVISPKGEVEDTMIEDSSGSESLERAAMQSVEAWRYSPATRNGVPVEQSMVETVIRFELEGGSHGARAAFVSAYIKIADLIKKGDLASVPTLIDELRAKHLNLYEDCWFWWLNYVYLDKSGSDDTEQMMRALQQALGYEQTYLPADTFVVAAERLYALQLKAGELSAAKDTFVRLRDEKDVRGSPEYKPAMARMTPLETKLEKIVAGDQLLGFKAEIGRHDYWVHHLLRRSFSMANVMGRVDVVDIRCDRATKRYDKFPIDGVWRVPESWGKCGVYIKGEPGTKFAFVEYPAATPATELSTD
jgi:TonB family protein